MHRLFCVAVVVASAHARSATFAHPQQPLTRTGSRCPAVPVRAVEDEARAALRLRGGDAASMLEGAKSSALAVPIVTRTWASIIVGLALLNQVGLVPPELLALNGALVVKKFQLWRLVTSACFFGGFGAQLLQKLYYLVSFGQQLEATIGAGEYLRVIVSCVAVQTFLFHLLGWQFLGDGLVMALTVLFAQLSPPGAQMSLYGLAVPYPLLPFAQLAMSYLFTQQVPYQDMAGLLVGYLHYFVNDNLKPDDAVQLPPPAKTGRASASSVGGVGADGAARKKRKGGKTRVTMNMAASSS